MCRIIIVLVLFISLHANSQGKHVFWDFEGNLKETDKVSNLKFSNKQLTYSYENRNNFLTSDNSTLYRINYNFNTSNKLSISFDFRGERFKITSLPGMNFRIQLEYDYIEFQFKVVNDSKVKTITHKIPLRGSKYLNYYYWINNELKKLNFTIDGNEGVIRVLINSNKIDQFNIPIEKFSKFLGDKEMTLRFEGVIDNLEFNPLGSNNSFINSNIKRENSLSEFEYDLKDFTIGYPNYTNSSFYQLKNYPLPRLLQNYEYKRNFPWFDITYLSWTHQPPNSRGAAEVQSKNAVDLMSTLHDQWNYYYEIPILRTNLQNADKTYSSKQTVPGALVDYARSRKDLKTAGILIQMQNNPKHIGSTYTKNLEWSGTLPNKYYVKDQTGKLILHNLKKVISPIAPLDFKYTDAKNSVFYLNNMVKYLGRPLDFINENGEISGHKIPLAVFEKDPSLKKDIQANGKNNVDIYNGYLQNRLDTAYKNEILRQLKWKNTQFSFYNVSAYNANYWPSYAERRTSNNTQGSNHYSTPSFYPASATYWYTANGSRNGLYNIVEGRVKEIQMGDKLFSPFISAGWDIDEKNILPSQWLALNKALVLFGAEYFYVGYFNVTGTKGWANGKGPNDPRGYLYQLVMPVYAQALFPYIEKFVVDGKFVGVEKTGNKVYRVPASKSNHLIYVKKYKNQFVIVASIQKNSNYKNVIPSEEVTEIEINGNYFKFKIRPQGSIYILEQLNQNYIVKQIDSWHEDKHPSKWSKDVKIEAELLIENINALSTENIVKKNFTIDLSNFITYARPQRQMNIPVYKNNVQSIKIKAKGNGVLSIDGRSQNINSTKPIEVEFKLKYPKMISQQINLQLLNGNLQFDYFIY